HGKIRAGDELDIHRFEARASAHRAVHAPKQETQHGARVGEDLILLPHLTIKKVGKESVAQQRSVPPARSPVPNKTSWPGFCTGNSRSRTAFSRLKMAVFAPIPSASESTATAVKPGFLASIRRP